VADILATASYYVLLHWCHNKAWPPPNCVQDLQLRNFMLILKSAFIPLYLAPIKNTVEKKL
jgi:hypothetical protein